MQNLQLGLIQDALVWEDPEANRAQLERTLAQIGSPDVVVLPEMFTTGFSTASTAKAESMDGASVAWMRDCSKRFGFALTGSIKIAEGERCVNRMIWMQPDGHFQYYDKRHLFRMAGEHERYSAGNQRVIVNFKGWRILLQVCYDLRFPVFSRNRDDYDLALYVANWPAARREPWCKLLPARAIENLAFVAGVNRIGTDGNGIDYAGDSQAFDFKGESLANLMRSPAFVNIELDGQALLDFRKKFPAHLDADAFELT